MQTELFNQEDQDTPVLGVTDLTRSIRKSLENQFCQIWVRGEISNLRAHSSGHFYFVLKDAQSQLKSVLFRNDALGLSHLPSEGEVCLVFGDITVYEPRGDYQIKVKYLMNDGFGNLRANFERLKQTLLNEGLFEESKKKPLPRLPAKIGVITSSKGAALQDFLSILERRGWGGQIILFDSVVQGKGAPSSLINCLQHANDLDDIELIVITRGGGSIEDLWAFNDERLVRAVSNCGIPIISAIGHQTDFVLTDFAADYRAETPSGAAEWISSQIISQRNLINDLQTKISEIVEQKLSKFNDQLSINQLRLDATSPMSLIEKREQQLDEFEHRLKVLIKHLWVSLDQRIESLDRRLMNCSVQSALNKGFAYFKGENGKILNGAKMLIKKSKVEAVFKDSSRNLEVLD